ncbi:hypothetical protein [Streptomyces sp. NPDC017991]|uniref:hypothetical protein n=1 Tax=Streptomyces sp. NPDC017991 TaxID=3365026 RepID=UPI0037BC9B97
MARRYSELTIKLLFGSASYCAYPGCTEPLVFKDRGRLTVVSQIAHIRSEQPNGPRHEPGYEPVNGFENVLLLRGKHHPPIDQHESEYSVNELEEWKAAQIAQAGHVLPAGELPEIVAALEEAAHAQERRTILRATWDSFSRAALPFCDHAQGALSRDPMHLNEQIVRDRRAFNGTMAALQRESPQDMRELAVAVRDCCDALILHANIYGPGWIAWRALDDARTHAPPERSWVAAWAQNQLGILIRAASAGVPAPEATYAEAETALLQVEGLTPVHVQALLEDASRLEPRITAIASLNTAREKFYEALEQFETSGLAHLAMAP